MAYNGIATILYVTAFLANAVSVYSSYWYYGHLAAAAVRRLTPLTLIYKGLVKYARNTVSWSINIWLGVFLIAYQTVVGAQPHLKAEYVRDEGGGTSYDWKCS